MSILDCLIDLGLSIALEHYSDDIDLSKLKDDLSKHIERQSKYFKLCQHEQEFDYEGLTYYLKEELTNQVVTRIFDPDSRRRKTARDEIISSAIAYANATTEEAKKYIASFVLNAIDIIREYYAKKIPKHISLISTQVTESVEKTLQEVASASTDSVIKRLDAIESNLSQPHLISLDSAVTLAENHQFNDFDNDIDKTLKHMSITHPLYPDYGYGINNSKIASIPLTREASSSYPPSLALKGTVRFGEKNYSNPSVNPFEYSYRHQLKLLLDVSDATQFLGRTPDPVQNEAIRLQGQTIAFTPPPFPPAFPCSIKVCDSIFYDYILLRTQEIMDDGTYIINNKDQPTNLFFEIRTKLSEDSVPDFSIRINNASNRELLHYASFIKALSTFQELHIYLLSQGTDLLAGRIGLPKYNSSFTSLDEELDYLERVCSIENYFSVELNSYGDVSQSDYNTIVFISDLIRTDEVYGTWKNVVLTGPLHDSFRETLLNANNNSFMFSYQHSKSIHLLGASFTLTTTVILEDAVIVKTDLDSAELLKKPNGEIINITLRANKNDTIIETLDPPITHLTV